MKPIRLSLLGRFSLTRETGRIERPISRRQQALLALVALDEETIDRSRLAGMLWADKDEQQARQSLRQLLLDTKSALDEHSEILKSNRTSVRLDRSLVQVDVTKFLQLAPNDDLPSLEEAASIYEGDLLPSFELGDELFDAWLKEKRDAIRRRATDVLHRLSLCLASEGRPGASLANAERLLDIDPWNETHLRFLLTQIATLRGLRHAVDYANDAERRWRREFGYTFEEPTRRLVKDLTASFLSAPSFPMVVPSHDSSASAAPDPLERKFVTVLVASFAGEIEMLSSDPEEAHDLATVAVDLMSGIVRSHGGTVASIASDRIVAIFGATAAHADHSARCGMAALRIQSEALTNLDHWPIGSRFADAFRAGIHSGEVIVKNGGINSNLFAVGQSMQIAERLHNLAGHGKILISTTALDLARYRHDCAVSVANQGEEGRPPTEMAELLAIQQNRSGLADPKRRGRAELIGRAKELASLSELIERARSGSPQFVCIEGEVGVGKSRLCWEAIRACQQNQWAIFEARAVDEAERRPPFEPIDQLIREVFGINLHDNADNAIDKASASGVAFAGSARKAILSLLGIEEPDLNWDSLSLLERRECVTQVILDILSSLGKSRPTLVLIEDTHRMSAEAQEIISRMTTLTFRTSLMMLVVGQHQRKQNETHWSARLVVEPLSPDQANTLLERLLGGHANGFIDKTKSEVISRTGGNPLFIEHYAQRLIEHSRDVIQARPDGVTVIEPSLLPIPITLRSLIQERIDQLNVGDKRLLQAAASIGIEGEIELLADVASRSKSEVSSTLRRLEEAKLILVKQGGPPVFRFTSGVVQEVAYGCVMSRRRTELNTEILRSLERRRHIGQNESPWERLAHHAGRAALWREAMKYHWEAGHRSVRMFAMNVARLHYERALAAQAKLPMEPDLEEQGVRLRLDLRIPLFAMSDQAAIQETLTEAYSIAIRLRQRKLIDRIEAYMVALHMARGDFDRSIEFSRRGARSPDLGVRAPGLANWASNLLQISDFRGAVRKSREVLRIIPAEKKYEPFGQVLLPAVYALSNVAISCAELGRFAEGEAAGKEAIEIANGKRRSYSDIIFAHNGLGRVYVRQGRLDLATPLLKHAINLVREHELMHFLPTVAPVLGVAYLLKNEPEAALRLLEPVAAFCDSKRMRNMYAFVIIVLAEACAALADNVRAHYYLEEAIRTADAQNQIGYVALALKAKGDIAKRADDELAQKSYVGALAIAESRGMRPLVAHLRSALAQIRSGRGSPDESHEHSAIAKSLYAAMKMHFWMVGN
jgi:DNA-binding SARP family transcriptional activator/class 3 adenylate cyclase/tetratricopeptide (TPR) repeat protein